MSNKLNIGLIGFGVVGEGVYHALQQTPSLQASIKKIAIKHADKKRNAPASLFTNEVASLLYDDDINVIIELIDDADAAYEIVKEALQQGKHVVSANKKMIAQHLPALITLQRKHQVSFLYEAAVCASIPIIRNLEEYFDNDLLNAIEGIVNGSTNFILTQIKEQGMSYDKALTLAQELGFAESNPRLDVEGIDAVNKLSILLKHTFGIDALPSLIYHKGITQLQNFDAKYALEKGYAIKLIANAFRISQHQVVAFVMPQFIKSSHQLSYVNNEYNGVLLSSSLSDKQFLYGKGAGRYPTAAAIVSDISALRYGYQYAYKKSSGMAYELCYDYCIEVYVSYNDEADIELHDFENISAKYNSVDGNYLIGEIKIDTLTNAPWSQYPNISIIHFSNNEQLNFQHEIIIEAQELACV